MRLYDLVLIIKSSLSEKEREKLIGTIKEWLKSVKIVKEEVWGQKPFAYKIKQDLSGFYHRMELEAAKIPDDFEKKLVAHEDVIRHLLLRKK
jgi:ribosomal protein S6